ncbi:MAG: CD3337/EF1877 family mobilome membrane protein [Alkaliphilus sp.]
MKKQHKKIAMLIFLMLILFSFDNISSVASSAIFPDRDIFVGNRWIDYSENYSLDLEEQSTWKKVTSPMVHIRAGINAITEIIFLVQKMFAYLLMVIVHYAFQINMYLIFSTMIDTIIGEMRIALFDELSLIGILLLGAYYCVKIVSDQKTQIWVAIIKTVVVVALAMLFFTQSSMLLQGVDNVSNEISKSVLAGTYRATNPGAHPDTVVDAIKSDIWMMFVHRPWQILNFGDISLAEQHQETLLKLEAGSEERQDKANELAEDYDLFKPNIVFFRVVFLLVYILPMLITFVVIAALALLILGYQFLTMFFFLMGIFVFIIALVPFFGTKVIEVWASKVLAYGFIKVIVSFVLALIFAFNSTLFKLIPSHGWIFVLILQTLIIAIIVWKKDTMIGLLGNIRSSVQHRNPNRLVGSGDVNIERRLNSFLKNKKRESDYDYYEFEDEYKNASRSTKKRSNAKESETWQPTIKEQASQNKQEVQDTQMVQSNETYHEKESLVQIADNMKLLSKKAEELLQMKYEEEKSEEDEKATKTGREPEYSPFVRRVNTREELGSPRFTTQEITATTNKLKATLRSGGTVEEFYSSKHKQSRDVISRPSSVDNIVIKMQLERADLDRKAAYKTVEKDSGEYAKEFNEEYGKGYSKEFFETLMRKHGRKNLEMTMRRMKEMDKEEIRNPAGYLTQSLKNKKVL